MELREKYMNENYKFEDFENKHKGERIFIIGTGASLRDFDWNKIRNETTMAFNKSVFHIPFWPNYYWIWDRNSNEENIYRLMDFAPCIKFSKYRWIQVKRLPVGDNRLYSREGLRRAGSSAIYTIELALFMGFDEIVILGIDLYIDKYYSFWQPEWMPTPPHFLTNKRKWFGNELLNEFRRFETVRHKIKVGHSPRSLLVRHRIFEHIDI